MSRSIARGAARAPAAASRVHECRHATLHPSGGVVVDDDDVFEQSAHFPERRRSACASRSAVVTSTRTSQSRGCRRPAAAFRSGLIGTNTPPAAEAPKTATTVSSRFSR